MFRVQIVVSGVQHLLFIWHPALFSGFSYVVPDSLTSVSNTDNNTHGWYYPPLLLSSLDWPSHHYIPDFLVRPFLSPESAFLTVLVFFCLLLCFVFLTETSSSTKDRGFGSLLIHSNGLFSVYLLGATWFRKLVFMCSRKITLCLHML